MRSSIGLLMLFFLSCTNNKGSDNSVESILKMIAPLETLENPKAILIIPIPGCSLCVDKVLGFTKANQHNKNMMYIISTKTIKEFKIRHGSYESINSTIVFDIEGIAKKRGLVSSYPVLLYMKEGKVIKEIELSGNIIEGSLETLAINLISLN